ncbi:hypothetical protein [Pseudomonas sp. LAM2023]|uniref:hypothetical protein n=1 Tax=Pseudomonas sp. LAM2023 TaxID=2800477 RepID=UPI00190AD7C4|nr:hypothetical protein [Pseudomonas sp. LAM2023]
MNRDLYLIGTHPKAIRLPPVTRALKNEPWAKIRELATIQHSEICASPSVTAMKRSHMKPHGPERIVKVLKGHFV